MARVRGTDKEALRRATSLGLYSVRTAKVVRSWNWPTEPGPRKICEGATLMGGLNQKVFCSIWMMLALKVGIKSVGSFWTSRS